MAFLALRLDLVEQEHAAETLRTRRQLRAMRRFLDAQRMTEADFFATYRLPKDKALQLIGKLKPLIPSAFGDMTPERKVLIALNFMATGADQRTIGRAHGVSQPSVSRALHDVVDALNSQEMTLTYMKFPSQPHELEFVKNRFYEKYHLPGVLGAIDGTLIPIAKPADNEEEFFNRKHFHSLNVQVICDADLRILSVDSSHPGSTHDSVIWASHSVNRFLKRLEEQGELVWLLGDSAYPQRSTMMTPVLGAQEDSEAGYYNYLQIRARNTVERCFGLLKSRWRCLAGKLRYSPIMAAKIVNSCAVLHNFCNAVGVPTPPDFNLNEERLAVELDVGLEGAEVFQEAVQNQPNRRVTRELVRGRAAREALIQRLQQMRPRQ